MIYELNTSEMNSINWHASGADRVIQNIINLINTSTYEVAYDRTRGMDHQFIDKPLDEAIGIAIAEINEVIESEPRATLLSVEFVKMLDEGELNFKVVIEIE